MCDRIINDQQKVKLTESAVDRPKGKLCKDALDGPL